MNTYNFEPLKKVRVIPKTARYLYHGLLSVVFIFAITTTVYTYPLFLVALVVIFEILYVVTASFITRGNKKALDIFVNVNQLEECNKGTALVRVPPALRSIGHTRVVSNAYKYLIGTEECIIFQYSCTTGNGKGAEELHFTIAVMKNNTSYPHLFLDGRLNGVTYAYKRERKIGLEGNFDRFFHLYVPEGEHIDALSIITPDIMQTAIDTGQSFDIELYQNYFAVFTTGNLYTYDGLTALLQCVTKIRQEFRHKDSSWQSDNVQSVTPQIEYGILARKGFSYEVRSLIIAGILLLGAAVMFVYFFLTGQL